MRSTRDFISPGRSVAVGDRGIAATSHPAATVAATDMLRAGGNAMDAALAAVAVQCVADPHMTGVGGDCFCLYGPADGPIRAFNGSGRAAAGTDAAALRALGLTTIPADSPHAVTVPGAVDAWCQLAAAYGSRPLSDILGAAIDAAEGGFVVTPRVRQDWARAQARISRHGAAVYLPGGQPPRVGDRLTHRALGATLRHIAARGRSALYEGPVAAELAALLHRLGGAHTTADFASHAGEWVEPISAPCFGYELFQCPPNGQGVIAILISRILERIEAASMGDADRIHVHAEATKAAYRQRDAVLADPASHPFNVAALMSDRAVATLAAAIRMDRASEPPLLDLPEHKDTVYVSVVDGAGNAVSLINSLFQAFGSGIYAPGAGVLLHNRGLAFSLAAGHPNEWVPGKRPMHTIIPGMLAQEGRAVMPFGVMGGHYQAAGQAQFLMNLLARGMDMQEASDAPRTFATAGVLQVEPTVPEAVRADLAARGHTVQVVADAIGGCQAIWIDRSRGVAFGASDHRKDGMALAVP